MKILFFGVTQFSVKGLKKLLLLKQEVVGVVVIPIHAQDIDNLKLICNDAKIPVYSFENVNDPALLDIVATELKPDLILTFTFPNKLSPEFLGLAKYALNMHPAFLPHYRGNNPYFWPIANGETETGVTFHFLNEHFDEGDIVLQEKVVISLNDTCGSVISKQEDVACHLLENILELLSQGKELPRHQQPLGDFPKAPKLALKDYFIHWDWDSKKITDRIRALNPYTGAYAQYKNSVLAIYEARATGYESADEPGVIVALSQEGPLVKSGNGAVILKILAVGKKYLLSGNDFIEYEKVNVGDKLIFWE